MKGGTGEGDQRDSVRLTGSSHCHPGGTNPDTDAVSEQNCMAADYVPGVFDNGGAGLFGEGKADESAEMPKRHCGEASALPGGESECSEETGGFAIPGIDSFSGPHDSPCSTDEEQPAPVAAAFHLAKMRESSKMAPAGMPGWSAAETSRINLNNQTDSVYYKNIFVPVETPCGADASEPYDPSFLFEPLQCKLCGLRFPSLATTPFGVHIEDHRRKNRALDEKIVLRREFFITKATAAPVKLNLTVCGEAEHVIWSREPPDCIVCGEKIKKVWKDEVEDWVLDSGVQINGHECAHRDCVL